MNQTPYPFSFVPPFTAATNNTVVDMWSRIGEVYKTSMQASSQELWTSSTRIIQEHAARGWVEASQTCMQALAQNAVEIQQRAFAQLASDNQKAAEIMNTGITHTAFSN